MLSALPIRARTPSCKVQHPPALSMDTLDHQRTYLPAASTSCPAHHMQQNKPVRTPSTMAPLPKPFRKAGNCMCYAGEQAQHAFAALAEALAVMAARDAVLARQPRLAADSMCMQTRSEQR